MVERLGQEGVAALGSLRFALGESYIISPVLRVELPPRWVFERYANEGDYYGFDLRPPGIADPVGPMIHIELAYLLT